MRIIDLAEQMMPTADQRRSNQGRAAQWAKWLKWKAFGSRVIGMGELNFFTIQDLRVARGNLLKEKLRSI